MFRAQLLFLHFKPHTKGYRSKRQPLNSSRWPIYVINSVGNTKLPCYTLPPKQHHSFFRNLPPFFMFIVQSPTLYIVTQTCAKRRDWDQKLRPAGSTPQVPRCSLLREGQPAGSTPQVPRCLLLREGQR